MVWGANFAVRRSAVERIGEFDESLDRAHGDEEEWLLRLRAAGGRIVYLADAGLDHRRSADDSGLAHAGTRRVPPRPRRALERPAPRAGARARARAARARRLRLAHASPRLPAGRDHGRPLGGARDGGAAAAVSSTRPDPATLPVRRRRRRDRPLAPRRSAASARSRTPHSTRSPARAGSATRLAGTAPAPLDVLVIGVYRPGSLLAEALPALRSERHRVRIAFGSTGPADEPLREHTVAEGLGGGKFENLNRVLEAAGGAADWTIVIDDDVRVPRAFVDRFVGVCEAFDLDLAQPAQTLRSHSAWKVTRRRPASLVRETRFVEIGPVTAFGRAAAAELLPFPELRYGWGLDLHWAAARCGARLAPRGGRRAARAARVRPSWPPRTCARTRWMRPPASWPSAPTCRAHRAGEVLAVHRRMRA